jgi:hypothetical protein
MAWSVEFLNEDIHAQLDALPEDIIASFLRIVRLIEIDGHVFRKKTQKTPRREIEFALKRAREVK